MTRGIGIVAVMAMAASISYAAPINYGNFNGVEVLYTDVTEAAGSPGDTEPLFGAPTIVGNTLAFPLLHTHGFSAVAQGSGDSSDTTIGTLSFGLFSTLDGPLEGFTVNESGDWQFTGGAGTSGAVSTLLTILVYSDAAHTNLLTSEQVSAGDFFVGPLFAGSTWSVSHTVDLIQFELSEVFVVINNNLQAVATSGATAFIHKKQFSIDGVAVPEPGAAMLLGMGALVLTLRRRRTQR